MKRLNLSEAKAKFSHLVGEAAKGKSFVIAKSGIPMAKLVPLNYGEPKKFKFGTLKGIISDEVADAIKAPLPPRILKSVLGG